MGALHSGHLSLVELSNSYCNYTIVSIFVNPTQFGENEDLDQYPQQLEDDLEKLNDFSVDCVFLPSKKEMYSENSTVFVDELELTKCMEGKSRPDFFRGVLTIVAKLFNIVEPTHSFFGEKDPSQLRLIKKMCYDLNFNIDIIPGKTIREGNGLAMSSRNEYLSPVERKKAGIIFKALECGKKSLQGGIKSTNQLKSIISEVLREETLLKIEYVSIADSVNLGEIDGDIENDVLVTVAVYIGNTRLIDNFTYSFAI